MFDAHTDNEKKIDVTARRKNYCSSKLCLNFAVTLQLRMKSFIVTPQCPNVGASDLHLRCCQIEKKTEKPKNLPEIHTVIAS